MCVPPRKHAGWPGDGYETYLEKVPLVRAEAQGQPRTEHQRFRLRDLLRYNLRTVRMSLFAEGGFPATLGVRIADLGWQVPR